MFRSDEDGVVLLGVPKNVSRKRGKRKQRADAEGPSASDSFLGGSPRWMEKSQNDGEALKSIVKCAKCSRPLAFIAQVRLPLSQFYTNVRFSALQPLTGFATDLRPHRQSASNALRVWLLVW
jgi:hypothetical protein